MGEGIKGHIYDEMINVCKLVSKIQTYVHTRFNEIRINFPFVETNVRRLVRLIYFETFSLAIRKRDLRLCICIYLRRCFIWMYVF